MNRQVRDVHIKINNYSREAYNSLKPLSWLLNLFAINNNVEDATDSKTCYISKVVITFTFFGTLLMYTLYYKIVYVYTFIVITTSIQLTDVVQMLYDLCQYSVDLWFVYKYGRHISLEYFRQYDCIDEILDMNYYSEIKRNLIKLIGGFTFIWILTSACDFAAWFYSFGWLTPVVYSLAYVFLYIKILTTLDLSSHVMHIKFRLTIICDIIQHYYSNTDSLPGFKGSFLTDKKWLNPSGHSRSMELKSREIEMKLQSIDESKEICLLTRCYLQLTEQVSLINSMFGLRILLNSLSLLIDIVRFTNMAVRIALRTQILPNESPTRYYLVVSTMMRQLTCVLVLFSLVKQCEKVYRQRDKITTTIDHILINKNPSDRLRGAMTDLRELVRSRPIVFNLAHFVILDNSFLISIASVVVTYTIIILQTMN